MGDAALGRADPAALPRPVRGAASLPGQERARGGADALGLVLGASGVGAIFSGLWLGQRGIGRRYVLWAYVGWGISVLCLAGYALTDEIWQAVAIGFVSGIGFTVGNIIWVTLMHRYVPDGLLGRVSALDWMVSIGLTPISFALAGPLAEAFGVEATLIGAGILACAVSFAFLAVPGIRDPERWEVASSGACLVALDQPPGTHRGAPRGHRRALRRGRRSAARGRAGAASW